MFDMLLAQVNVDSHTVARRRRHMRGKGGDGKKASAHESLADLAEALREEEKARGGGSGSGSGDLDESDSSVSDDDSDDEDDSDDSEKEARAKKKEEAAVAGKKKKNKEASDKKKHGESLASLLSLVEEKGDENASPGGGSGGKGKGGGDEMSDLLLESALPKTQLSAIVRSRQKTVVPLTEEAQELMDLFNENSVHALYRNAASSSEESGDEEHAVVSRVVRRRQKEHAHAHAEVRPKKVGAHFDAHDSVVVVETEEGDAFIDHGATLQSLVDVIHPGSDSDSSSGDTDDSDLDRDLDAAEKARRAAQTEADRRELDAMIAFMADDRSDDEIPDDALPDIFVAEAKVPAAFRLRWLSSDDDESSDTDPSLGLSYSDSEGVHHSHAADAPAPDTNKACTVM